MTEINQNIKGRVVWLTGLSASGKTTLSTALAKKLTEEQRVHYVLDGDKIRKGLSSDLGFSHEDRSENIRRIGEVAKLFCDAGIHCLVAFISPYRSDRDHVREILDEGQFIEVYVDCPLEECEKRDPKGLYVKARKGEIADFTGISAPYEPPEKPEIHLKTAESTVDECINEIYKIL